MFGLLKMFPSDHEYATGVCWIMCLSSCSNSSSTRYQWYGVKSSVNEISVSIKVVYLRYSKHGTVIFEDRQVAFPVNSNLDG